MNIDAYRHAKLHDSGPDTQVHRQEFSLETIDFIGFVDLGQERSDDNLTTKPRRYSLVKRRG